MEENKKSFLENGFVKEFVEKYTAVRGADKVKDLIDRKVGNNGYSLGQQFTFTGKIGYKEQNINGTNTVYIVLFTEENTEISLMSLMGVSSLKGYELEKPVEVEFGTNQKKQTRTVKSELIDNFDFDDVWQPATRNFLELAAMIASGELPLAGKKATFLGTAVKPFRAKKSGEQNNEKYVADMQRAIETKLWKVQ